MMQSMKQKKMNLAINHQKRSERGSNDKLMIGGGVFVQQQMAHEVDKAHGGLHLLIEVFGTWTILGFTILGIWVVWNKKMRGFFK